MVARKRITFESLSGDLVPFRDIPIMGTFYSRLGNGSVEKWYKLSQRSARIWQGDPVSSFSEDWMVKRG